MTRIPLAALDADSRRALEVAAVIGDRIEVPQPARVCGEPPYEVLRALDVAAEAERGEGAPGTAARSAPVEFVFSGGLIRAALLATRTPSRQHALRAAVERALTAQEGRPAHAVSAGTWSFEAYKASTPRTSSDSAPGVFAEPPDRDLGSRPPVPPTSRRQGSAKVRSVEWESAYAHAREYAPARSSVARGEPEPP
ncbi:hypothetical protein [Streptomyces sp. LBL]|uniref:hypothetical protein n=1 Tax=Streptomyces sp. LBL TaxID=2940562 RepID=UPI002475F183|nr:hypothetical protein [Streptomyces sp. LBL]